MAPGDRRAGAVPGQQPGTASGAVPAPERYTRAMKLLRLTLLGLALALPAAGFAQWQWIDKDGRKVFSDRPPPADVPDKNILSQPGAKSRAAVTVETPAAGRLGGVRRAVGAGRAQRAQDQRQGQGTGGKEEAGRGGRGREERRKRGRDRQGAGRQLRPRQAAPRRASIPACASRAPTPRASASSSTTPPAPPKPSGSQGIIANDCKPAGG